MQKQIFLVLVVCAAIFSQACVRTKVANENRIKVFVPTPIPPAAVSVDKPVNVSFSTYSKDWPVGWQWIDPDEKTNQTPHDVKTGVLRVRMPTKKDLFGEALKAPRYIKPITGDFQIETRVRFLPKENYQGAGLLIYKDDENYIKFEHAYGGSGGGGEGLRFDARSAHEYRPITPPGEIHIDSAEVDLKIVRSGKIFTAFWRLDEDGEWRTAGEFDSDYPDTIFAGLIASNTAREASADFEYIHLLPPVGHR